MKASILDLRRRMAEVLRALDRNEPVKILYRGRERAILLPTRNGQQEVPTIKKHPVFGMWKDHEELADVGAYVRKLRKSRFHAT
jgi:antitoxin (DNA-binding transcriptional repressor) of toxin-antitoxin stability system